MTRTLQIAIVLLLGILAIEGAWLIVVISRTPC